MNAVALLLIAALAGVSFVFQQAVNSNLRSEIGFPFWAGAISYAGGTLAMLVMVVLMREPWSAPLGTRSSLLSWTGGIFGAVYIAISILVLPRLGATALIACLVLGQMVASLTFDHYGLLGVPVHEITAARLVGVALLLAGVVLVRI